MSFSHLRSNHRGEILSFDPWNRSQRPAREKSRRSDRFFRAKAIPMGRFQDCVGNAGSQVFLSREKPTLAGRCPTFHDAQIAAIVSWIHSTYDICRKCT